MSNEKSNTDELQSLQDFESPAKALKRSMHSFEGVLNCDDLEALRDQFEQCEALNAYNEQNKKSYSQVCSIPGFGGYFAKEVSDGPTEFGNVNKIGNIMGKHVSDCW